MLFVKLVVLSSLLYVHANGESLDILPADQVKNFRSWMVTIIEDQISRGANPRWNHRDCAGLVRFSVAETLAHHDVKWRKSNGMLGRPLPAEIELSAKQRLAFKKWKNSDGDKLHFVRALPLIQNNAVFLGRSTDVLEPGDLLFFDQGDEQHLMVWTGKRVAYHNGSKPRKKIKTKDNGLRVVNLKELMNWSDTRWQPRPENPNFIGFYRLSFLNLQNNRRVNE